MFAIFFLLLSSLNPLFLCSEEFSPLIIHFQSKNLQKEDDPDEDEYGTHWNDDSDYLFVETEQYNTSRFLNEWFYNGMYTKMDIGSKSLYSYLNLHNSYFSIEKCNLNRVYCYSTSTCKSSYNPIQSPTFLKKDNNMGNDIFSFYGDFKYKTNIKIGEEKGKGLDFIFSEDDNNSDLCGNLGLNINMNSEETNLLSQLKNKKYINKYIWTLNYQTKEDGNIVIGTEPHFYGDYYMSQFCTIKAVPNQSPDTSWSFKMGEIITYDINKKKIFLSNKKIDVLIDRGLIVGTDEFKKIIDELIFNNLISQQICFRDIKTFDDIEKNIKDEYYIYYCEEDRFIKNIHTIEKTYYNTFPNLDFYVKEHNFTYSLTKTNLFFIKNKKVFFLIIFKKSTSENKIWKMGEPFLLNFQLTFNQEQKTVGFYNPYLKKIPNEDYMKINEENNQQISETRKNKYLLALYIVLIIIGIVLLIIVAYFLGKKINERRKKRANELKDEDFDYIVDKKYNDNNIDTNGPINTNV